jgi:predicted component of type VI protein secretion system
MRRESPIVPEDKAERPMLIWEREGARRVTFEVWPERPITFGREQGNTVVIDSAFVSKSHAVIRYVAGQYQVEDLKSANGTRVNGQPIAMSVLGPGDVLEVGDQRFVFREKTTGRSGAAGQAAAAPGGLHKNTKLMLTAIGSLGLFAVLFALMAPSSGTDPASGRATEARTEAPPVPAGPAPAVDPNGAAVKEVLAHAQQAGVKPADALFDEGNIALEAGRMREAAQLFAAVLARDPKNDAAIRRLDEAKTRWVRAIADHVAEAERAFNELRLNDAMLEWGQVAQLTDDTDPRHKAALAGIERAQKQMAR